MPLNMEDAEQIKKIIVDPMIEALKAELEPFRDTVENHEWRIKGQYSRIVKLEKNQRKAMIGYAGIVLLVSTGFTALVDWAKRKVGL